jgi:hypothetical protein
VGFSKPPADFVFSLDFAGFHFLALVAHQSARISTLVLVECGCAAVCEIESEQLCSCCSRLTYKL